MSAPTPIDTHAQGGDNKIEAIQLETRPSANADADGHVDDKERDVAYMLKSDQDHLSTKKTAWLFRKAVLVCTLLCIAAGADGYQISLHGNIIANAGFVERIGFPNAQGVYQLDPNHTALWGGLGSLGQLMAMLTVNTISDRFGRKYTLYFLWCVLLCSLLLETFVVDWKMWCGAKITSGFGVGAIQSTLPVYITEWAPVNIRGAMLLSYGIWNSIGSFLAPVVLNAWDQQDPMNWRAPIVTQFAFLGIMAPIFLYLPETASYFASRGEHDKAKKTLLRVNGKVPGYDVEREYAVVINTIEEERRLRSQDDFDATSFKSVMISYTHCFRGVNLKRTLAASLPLCMQQLTGLSFLNTYSSFFFRQAGFDDPFQITAILTSIKIATILCLVFLSEIIGRRFLILFGGFWATSMLLVVAAAGQSPALTSEPIRNLTIAAACLWSVGSSCLGNFGWAFVGEVASQRLRARTAGVAAGISVLFGITFNTSVPVLLATNGANWGYKTGWLFFALGLVSSIGALFLIPETARRSPAELDELYDKRISVWKMKHYVTDVQRDYESRYQRGDQAS